MQDLEEFWGILRIRGKFLYLEQLRQAEGQSLWCGDFVDLTSFTQRGLDDITVIVVEPAELMNVFELYLYTIGKNLL